MTHRLRAILWVDPLTIEEETDRGESLALTLAERVHQLGQSSRALDLEEDLVVVISHFNVEVFGAGGLFLCVGWRLVALIGHVGANFGFW